MGKIFSAPKPAVQEPPPIPEPVPIPDAEDPTKKIEARKRAARRIASSGRESTFLTKSDKLGGA